MNKRPIIKMEEMKEYPGNIVFIDGITRSGKFWMANALIHFDRMEHMQHYPVVDACVHMNLMGILTDNAAISLLQNEIRTRMYETAIGRNVNFRLRDSSSVCKNPNFSVYLERITGEDVNPHTVEKWIDEGDRIFLFIVHDWLCNAGICFKAFPKLKMICMERNPADIVYAWHKKGHGRSCAFSWRIETGNGFAPWFTYKWNKDYKKLGEMDRIIRAIVSLSKMTEDSWGLLSQAHKEQILFSSYETLALQTEAEIKRIAAFIKTKPLPSIRLFLDQDVFKKRNKKVLEETRKEKIETIRKQSSKEMFSLLLRLEERYEQSKSNVG